MVFGSYEELEACIQLLMQLRSETVAKIGGLDDQHASLRLRAVEDLLDQYQSYAAFTRQFFGHRQPGPLDL